MENFEAFRLQQGRKAVWGNQPRYDAGTGAGSRGGNVIGRTRSGKPIYQNHGHPEHNNFNAPEHTEAANKHKAIAKDLREVGHQMSTSFGTAAFHDAHEALHRRSAKTRFQASLKKNKK